MINKARTFIFTAFILAISAIGTMAQYGSYNTSNSDVLNIISRIQNRAERMRQNLNSERSSNYGHASQNNRLESLVQDFQNQTSALSSRVQQRRATSSDAQLVLSRANQIDTFIDNNSGLSSRVRSDWSSLDSEVDNLARAYNLSWNGGYDDGYNNGGYQYPGNYPNYPSNNTSNGYLIANNATVVATLNNDLSTKEMQEGQRFTMTVQSPSQYRGAIIEGYVSGVERSGKVSGRSKMTLNFQTIRFHNSSYRFSGTVEEVRDTKGNTINTDEGTIQDNNRTKTTVTRAGIGAGIGAIIGAIAGGGKGAAIGAAIGAGAGAGTTYIQGRDDLDLQSGSQMTIRSSAPNYRR